MFFAGKYLKRIIAAGLLLPVMGSVAACGASSDEKRQEEFELSLNSLQQQELNYEVPTQIPGIAVDQVGFRPSSEKVAVFKGQNLPEKFGVYALETGDLVYTGDIVKSTYCSEIGDYVSIGRFGELDTQGTYYIKTGVLGESYSFSISDSYYSDIFDTACKKYYMNRCGTSVSENYAGGVAHSACHTSLARLKEDPSVEIDVTGGWHMDEQAGRDALLGCRISENLLLAYEMNSDVFTDETGIPESGNGIPDILDEIRYEADWLLKMQDQKTGGVYGAAVTDTGGGSDLFTAPVIVTPVSMDATIGFAAMMARFSFFYQSFDADYALACLKAADRAWNCFLNNKDPLDETAAFNAAAQLYRATGASNYSSVLSSYFASGHFEQLFHKDENVFMGSVTYLSTGQKVDVKQCEEIMKALMKKAGEIAKSASSSPYLVSSMNDKDSFDQMLKEMRCLTITDHIIYNHEYTTIIENHVHFMMGMNPEAVNYVTADTERTYVNSGVKGVLNDPESDALFIFMLSVL